MRERQAGRSLSAHAIAGTHVVLLGLDVEESARPGLMGFAIHRTDLETGEAGYLPNFLRLPVNDRENGPTSSRANPIQAFVWGDYSLHPGRRLRYRVEALYGEQADLEVGEAVELEVGTHDPWLGRHGVWFNRGAAGSQRFVDLFGDIDPRSSPEALAWLSRGLAEALARFVERAEGPRFALRGAFYEFEQPAVLAAFRAAHEREADVSLVVARPLHDRDDTPGPDAPTPDNLAAVADAELDELVRWRSASNYIAHNKFCVLLEAGRPTEVWTGSTNITDSGIYGHSNVGHVVRDAEIARKYLRYWERLAGDTPTGELRDWVDTETPLPPGEEPEGPLTSLFSPRHGLAALRWYADRIRGADQAVFLTAPFGVGEVFEDALLGTGEHTRYVLLDKADNHMDLLRANRHIEITHGAYLGRGAWRQFMRERLSGLTGHVHFVHTKYLLVDPLTDDPLVITGSANFSPASTSQNDENMLLISGDTRVADVYLTEFMRTFTHLRFRASLDLDDDQRGPDPRAGRTTAKLLLRPDDSWTENYFADGPKRRERLLFR